LGHCSGARLCPKCHRGQHWANQCHSRFTVDDEPINPTQDNQVAGIAEILNLKWLRKGMNRQDTNQEDQKADDQMAKFLFLHQAYKQYEAECYTKQEELLFLGNNALVPTSVVS
jgi:hypothetical protein